LSENPIGLLETAATAVDDGDDYDPTRTGPVIERGTTNQQWMLVIADQWTGKLTQWWCGGRAPPLQTLH